ncbi:BLUF domain-containing protein [Psychroserpens sp. SPM9]|uniref:BLUF domain-containing protein n=1 Tax=Psychroserpens sp. SPM9 TaxID=2975598 RepID=UPI0021A3FD0D|nr:BLUF domain-containing protein [Psychroserpens sp. SPM9]MDG5492342.1 BLUF domain-containing protein [Psychroserpens sp. SPM9]
MFYSIIYQSKAKAEFTIAQIDMMLLKAKQFNKTHNISGCIIYNGHKFLQIIEGQKADIIKLYAKIKADQRHENVITLIETSTHDTLWDDWSMAFYKFTGDATKDQHNHMLLDLYFNAVSDHQKSSEVYNILRENVSQLLTSNKQRIY